MHIHPPIIAALFLLAMAVAQILLPLRFGFAGQSAMAVLVIVLALILIAVAGALFFKAKTTIMPDRIQETSALVTSGIYRFTRNPMYLGMAIGMIGVGLYFGTLWAIPAIAGFVLVINRVQIAPEEKVLAEKFGQDFTDYCARVRRWV